MYPPSWFHNSPFSLSQCFTTVNRTTGGEFATREKSFKVQLERIWGSGEKQASTLDNIFLTSYQPDSCPILNKKKWHKTSFWYCMIQIRSRYSIFFPSRIWVFYLKVYLKTARWLRHWYHLLFIEWFTTSCNFRSIDPYPMPLILCGHCIHVHIPTSKHINT